MRKPRRMVAHNKMRKDGLTQVNKKKAGHSFFLENWRTYKEKKKRGLKYA